MTIATGTKLGRYEICSLLGVGGTVEVYPADDTVLPRRVAIKLLTSDYIKSEERLHRFEREAYAASSWWRTMIVPIGSLALAYTH